MTTIKYTVRTYFLGEPRADVDGDHRTLAAAVEAAGKLFRKGSAGWDARVVVPSGEDIYYTARTADGREVNITH